MDYQYAQIVGGMNYLALVNTLSMQITPEIRKLVLDRLVEMNNEVLSLTKTTGPTQSPVNIPSSRPPLYNDSVEIVHPSFIYRPVPVPRSKSPIGSNSPEIDLDEILGDSHEDSDDNDNDSECKNESPAQPDDLDIRLARIKQLHTKIITDKRKRRRERERNARKQNNS